MFGAVVWTLVCAECSRWSHENSKRRLYLKCAPGEDAQAIVRESTVRPRSSVMSQGSGAGTYSAGTYSADLPTLHVVQVPSA